MNTRNIYVLAATTLSLSALAGSALASTPIAVYSTGFKTGSTTEQASEGVDGNYSLVTTVQGTTLTQVFVTDKTGFPIGDGDWMADTATSQWISPQANYNPLLSDPAGNYIYQTTFVLPANFATALLNIQWAVDNSNDGIYLNGHLISGTSSGGSLTSLTTVPTITTGFQSGINTLDLEVTNAAGTTGNPTGVNAIVSGSYTTFVPEPTTNVACMVGILGLSALILRKKQFKRSQIAA